MWFINRWIQAPERWWTQPPVNIYKKDKKGNIRWPLTLLKEKKMKKVLASITNKLNAIHMFLKSWMPAERGYNHFTLFDTSIKASNNSLLVMPKLFRMWYLMACFFHYCHDQHHHHKHNQSISAMQSGVEPWRGKTRKICLRSWYAYLTLMFEDKEGIQNGGFHVSLFVRSSLPFYINVWAS